MAGQVQIERQPFDFSYLLKDGEFSDTEFVHAHSDLKIRLHSSLLRCYGIDLSLQSELEGYNWSPKVFQTFFGSLYGSSVISQLPTLQKFTVQDASPSSNDSMASSSTSNSTTESSVSGHSSNNIWSPVLSQSVQIVYLTYLYHKIRLEPAIAWATSALKDLYLSALTIEETVTLLMIVLHECQELEILLEIIFGKLREHPGDMFSLSTSNEELRSLAAENPMMYGMIFFKMGSTSSDYQSTVAHHLAPKCYEWLQLQLQSTLLEAALPIYGRIERNIMAYCSTAEAASKELLFLSDYLPLAPIHSVSSDDLPEPQPYGDFSHLISKPDASFAGNMIIEIDGYGPSTRAEVHDWVVALRWPWMRRLLSIGMREAQERRVLLPPHFPPYLLSLLITHLYGGKLDPTFYESISQNASLNPLAKVRSAACSYLLSRGAEYEICSMAAQSANAIRARPGFEAIVSYCKRSMLKTLTVDNCLQQLRLFTLDEGFDEELQQTIDFIAKHTPSIVKTDANLAIIEALPESVWKKIFIAHMKQAPFRSSTASSASSS